MDTRIIEALLEKYWNCETTTQQEEQIRRFFNEEQVPEHLERYRELFSYQSEEAAPSLGSDFDERIMGMIRAQEAPKTGRAPRMNIMRRAVSIAAVILLTAGVWIAYDRTFSGNFGDMTADTFSTPEEAIEGMGEVFSFINAKMEKGHEVVGRSIEKTAPIREMVSTIME